MKTLNKFVYMLLALGLLLFAAGCGAEKNGGADDQSAYNTPASVSAPAPEPAPTPAPTDTPELALAKKLLASMTLKEKAGQLLLVRCPSADAAQTAYQFRLGGYVLFGADFDGKTSEQVQNAISGIQNAARLPMLIAVDEEGGSVCRVSSNPNLRASRFPSPQNLYADGGWEAVRADTVEKCSLLCSLGVNLNLAPVCDVSNQGSFMYDRSFGPDANLAGEYVSTVVGIMGQSSMGCALKHFPGYGDNADTHTGSAHDERTLESFRETDFLPFIAGIEAGAGSVLVSHNVVECMDAEAPASLSGAVHEVLRDELGFEGVIITDDLDMDAITEFSAQNETSTAVLAVLAGNDMLCCSDYEGAMRDITSAVTVGTITEERLDESVLRVLMWKISLGLITEETAAPSPNAE